MRTMQETIRSFQLEIAQHDLMNGDLAEALEIFKSLGASPKQEDMITTAQTLKSKGEFKKSLLYLKAANAEPPAKEIRAWISEQFRRGEDYYAREVISLMGWKVLRKDLLAYAQHHRNSWVAMDALVEAKMWSRARILIKSVQEEPGRSVFGELAHYPQLRSALKYRARVCLLQEDYKEAISISIALGDRDGMKRLVSQVSKIRPFSFDLLLLVRYHLIGAAKHLRVKLSSPWLEKLTRWALTQRGIEYETIKEVYNGLRKSISCRLLKEVARFHFSRGNYVYAGELFLEANSSKSALECAEKLLEKKHYRDSKKLLDRVVASAKQ